MALARDGDGDLDRANSPQGLVVSNASGIYAHAKASSQCAVTVELVRQHQYAGIRRGGKLRPVGNTTVVTSTAFLQDHRAGAGAVGIEGSWLGANAGHGVAAPQGRGRRRYYRGRDQQPR